MPDLSWKHNQKVGSVQYVVQDDMSETTVTVYQEDDRETICRKLRKVLELAGPEIKVVHPPSFRPMAQELLDEPGPQPTNGWGDMLKPQIPEHAKDTYEIIPEGESE